MAIELDKETVKYLLRKMNHGGHESEQARAVLKAASHFDDNFLMKEEARDEHGRWTSGGGSSSDGGDKSSSMHTPAHEASRNEAVDSVNNYQKGWNSGQSTVEQVIGNHSLEEAKNIISSGGTRDDLKAKTDEARAYADKLAEQNKQGFISGSRGWSDYPSMSEVVGANIAETQAKALEVVSQMWDSAAQTNGK